MKNKINFYISFIIISFSILFIFLGFFMTYYHELAHKTIFQTYGVQSEVHMFEKFPIAITRADIDDYKLRCNDDCKMANDLNEMIYYPIQFIYAILGTGLFFLIILKCMDIKIKCQD